MTNQFARYVEPAPTTDSEKMEAMRTALLLILDNIDYEAGNCRINEMIGAVLPKEMLRIAKSAVKL